MPHCIPIPRRLYPKADRALFSNNGLSRVQGNGSGRILVIKDSYANCFVPYLTANYADIDVVPAAVTFHTVRVLARS